MCYWWPNQRGYVQYVRIGPNGKVTKSVDIPVDGMPMIHDMSITERYITHSRQVEDIRLLVTLAEGLGRLTPPMESFRQLAPAGGNR